MAQIMPWHNKLFIDTVSGVLVAPRTLRKNGDPQETPASLMGNLGHKAHNAPEGRAAPWWNHNSRPRGNLVLDRLEPL